MCIIYPIYGLIWYWFSFKIQYRLFSDHDSNDLFDIEHKQNYIRVTNNDLLKDKVKDNNLKAKGIWF